ncbi:hypothetical protein D3C86_1115330 [compost metagenome]
MSAGRSDRQLPREPNFHAGRGYPLKLCCRGRSIPFEFNQLWMPRRQRVIAALQASLPGDMHSGPHCLPAFRLNWNDRIQVGNDGGWDAKALDERPEPVRVTASNVDERHILLGELRKISFYEERYEHSLSSPLDENGSIGE